MGNTRKLSASCIVINDEKVLLVKHTYGAAKGKYLIPGGFSEEGEMPQITAEREVLEETGVTVKAGNLAAVRFTLQEVWCIFLATYIEGEPISDNYENEDALFMPLEEAITSEKVVATSRELIRAVLDAGKATLQKSDYVNPKFEEGTWQLFL